MVYSAKSDTSTISQFTRRKSITINTNGTSTPALYQTKLTILYSPGMNADFSDIRFNTKSGTYIDYWIESKVDSDTAYVWVELIDVIADPGSDSIWMYYGNAAVSDGGVGGDTFVFFDDFSGDLSKWTTAGTPTILDGILTLDSAGEAVRSINTYGAYGVSLTARFCPPVSTVSHTWGFSEVAVGTNPVGNINYRFAGWQFHLDGAIYITTGNGAGFTQPSVGAYTTDYGEYRIDWTNTEVKFYKNNVLLGTNTLNIPSTALYVNLYATTGTSLFDYVFVRKYASPEPTATLGTAQHQRRIPTFL